LFSLQFNNMIGFILKKFSGSHYRRFIKKSQPVVEQINRLDQQYQGLSDEALRGKTAEFKARFAKGETLDSLLPEAFATVKNAARRLSGKTFDVCGLPQTWNMIHYDVQLIGGMALHSNRIAEMATGEGKTLVATLPLYLNALTGKNAQLVTVNDYLARRDSTWMGYLYQFLGLTVGCIQNGMHPHERREAYACDITYGTASEFGFDYLRDNGMATRKEDQVQRQHYFVIVDEVDSILIDEARTPLIISGPVADDRQAPFLELKPDVERLDRLQNRLCNQLVSDAKGQLESTDKAVREDALMKLLQVRKGMPKNKQFMRLMENNEYRRIYEKYELEMQGDFNSEALYKIKEELYFAIDEKNHQADLTAKGRKTLRPNDPDAFVMPDLPTIFVDIDRRNDISSEEKQKLKQEAETLFMQRSEEIHCLGQLLRAYSLYEKDVEYVVQDDKVMIVDENTGRLMPGRRWSDGLHQAVEAKEGVSIEKETKTYATITIQNYFRMYEKLAGMTGTAETEAGEFHEIYGLEVMVIPTHRPCIRTDRNDIIYKTRREKYNAAMADIEEAHKRGQPVLVGTTSVEASELLSRMMKRSSIPHNVLNAKFHEQEAEIVALAGQKGAVTIATNMAGRGTDIKLGQGVADIGGLFVLGTERHESRRIDRQLRGRCARQGDPGSSKFFVSLEDNLMRLFSNAGMVSRILEKSFSEGEELEHPLLNRSIETAQKKVEQQNFTSRKRLLQYDDVLNTQREVVYGIRNEAIHSDHPQTILDEMLVEEVETRLSSIDPGKERVPDPKDVNIYYQWISQNFPIAIEEQAFKGLNIAGIRELSLNKVREAYARKRSMENPDAVIGLEQYIIISSIDRFWQDHLTEMEDLRRSVGLRGYGQKDPLQEYKKEAFMYFEEMMGQVRASICTGMFRTATNLETFQNMLEMLSRRAQTVGPETADAVLPAKAGKKGEAVAEKKEVQLPNITIRHEIPKIGRNDMVTIQKGAEIQQLKFKKAESLILNEGWKIVDKK